MQWYCSKNGTQLGPVEPHELLAGIITGWIGVGLSVDVAAGFLLVCLFAGAGHLR